MNEIQEIAFEYGRAVAWREYFAHNVHAFKPWDQDCMRLWKRLIELGAYVDEECSQLKDEAADAYLRGLNSVPTRMRHYPRWVDDEEEWVDDWVDEWVDEEE